MAWIRTWIGALVLAAGLTLVAALPASAGEFSEFPRGGEYKKYEGNPKWWADVVYDRDSDLGTPPSTKPQFGEWVDAGGKKKVRVVRRFTQRAQFQRRYDNNMTFVGLEDEDGKVLLPVVYRSVHAVAGRGIYLQSYLGEQPYEFLDLKTGKRTVVPGLIQVVQHTVGSSFIDGAVLIYTTGEAKVKVLRARRSGDFSSPARGTPQGSEKPVPVGRIEVYGGDGQLQRVLSDLAPIKMTTQPPLYGSTTQRAMPLYLQMRSETWFVGLILPGGELAMQALDASFAPVGNVFPWAVDTRTNQIGFVAPAPDVPDAWVEITDKGEMAAPPGALAYRPFDDGVMSGPWLLASAYEQDGDSYLDWRTRWLVAYPAAEGVRWGYLKEDKTPTGPLWREFIHLQTELAKEAWASFGSQVAVQKLDGSWSLMSRTFGELLPQTYATLADTLAAAEGKVLARNAQEQLAAGAQQAQVQQAAKSVEEERWARWNALKAAGHWQELEQVSDIWGGDYFAAYVDLNPAPRLADVQRAMAGSGDALLRADHWNAKLKAAEARAGENERIRQQAELDVIIAENERKFEESLFRPDGGESGGGVDTLQRLKDYNTSVNQSNCAVADKGGIRSCSR